MRKFLALAATVILGGALLIAGCGNDNKQAASDGKQVLKIGATAVPHAEILEQVKPILAKDGIELKITEFTDYNTPNLALGDKEIDANFFQHVPYLKAEKKSHGYKIEELGKVFTTPMGVYSKKYKNLKDIPEGSTIYVSNNPAEEGRFLSFFVDEGLIKLKKGVKIEDAKFEDIAENKKNLKFNHQQGAEFLPKTYKNGEGAAVIMNSNYAIDNGLKPSKDAIVMEGKSSPFANIIAVQEGHKKDKKFQELLKVMQSKEIKDYIKKEYGDDVIPYESK